MTSGWRPRTCSTDHPTDRPLPDWPIDGLDFRAPVSRGLGCWVSSVPPRPCHWRISMPMRSRIVATGAPVASADSRRGRLACDVYVTLVPMGFQSCLRTCSPLSGPPSWSRRPPSRTPPISRVRLRPSPLRGGHSILNCRIRTGIPLWGSAVRGGTHARSYSTKV
jgi:hypothetical protein